MSISRPHLFGAHIHIYTHTYTYTVTGVSIYVLHDRRESQISTRKGAIAIFVMGFISRPRDNWKSTEMSIRRNQINVLIMIAICMQMRQVSPL